jgi:hypothetical protein
MNVPGAGYSRLSDLLAMRVPVAGFVWFLPISKEKAEFETKRKLAKIN